MREGGEGEESPVAWSCIASQIVCCIFLLYSTGKFQAAFFSQKSKLFFGKNPNSSFPFPPFPCTLHNWNLYCVRWEMEKRNLGSCLSFTAKKLVWLESYCQELSNEGDREQRYLISHFNVMSLEEIRIKTMGLFANKTKNLNPALLFFYGTY